LLQEGQNEVTLQSVIGSTDISLVDRVRLTFARAYQANGDQLRFTTTPGKPTRISGL